MSSRTLDNPGSFCATCVPRSAAERSLARLADPDSSRRRRCWPSRPVFLTESASGSSSNLALIVASPGAKEVRRWLLAEEDDPCGVGAPPLASRRQARKARKETSSFFRPPFSGEGGNWWGTRPHPPRRKRSMRKTGSGRAGGRTGGNLTFFLPCRVPNQPRRRNHHGTENQGEQRVHRRRKAYSENDPECKPASGREAEVSGAA